MSQALDCTAMLMFYAKVIRQRNAVLEHIGHQFGYRPQAGLVARVGHGGEDDYAAFMVNVMTCIAHSGSFKEALENGVRMGMHEPAFFCIVGALASTLWGVPKPWAHEISRFIQRQHPHYLQILRGEARGGPQTDQPGASQTAALCTGQAPGKPLPEVGLLGPWECSRGAGPWCHPIGPPLLRVITGLLSH